MNRNECIKELEKKGFEKDFDGSYHRTGCRIFLGINSVTCTIIGSKAEEELDVPFDFEGIIKFLK